MSKKMPILGTGLSGLIGSRVVELLKDQYQFTDLSLETGVDIRNKPAILAKVGQSKAEIVLHLAAKTDVDGCEKERDLREKSQAWQINVVGTKNIVEACQKLGKRIFYISTDFVFDGENGPYSEEDSPNPINFYAQTKYEAEKIVQILGYRSLILRISYPYRASFTKKSDVVRSMINKLQKDGYMIAIVDQLIVPTFIDDIAQGLDLLIKKNAWGIYHLVGSQAITPYQLAKKVTQIFNLSGKIVRTTLADYYKARAKRPYKSVLKNDKMRSLGARLLGVEEALLLMKRQQDSRSSFSL